VGEQSSDRVLLGHITGVSGLKGWVKVHSDTNPRDNIVSYRSWSIQTGDSWEQVKVLAGRPQGKTIVASLEGVTSPEQAAKLVGSTIAVQRSDMPVLDSGEFYWADLTGMHVRTVDGVALGSVSRLFETGANDVVVISDERTCKENEEGKRVSNREILVPWLVPDVITDVDLQQRVITVDWDPDF